MSKYVTNQVILNNLGDHPAVRAWFELGQARLEPNAVHILKERRKGKRGKSAVYRLAGAGPGGSAVVAKQCHQSAALVERTIYENILPRLPVSGLGYYGFLEEPEGESYWLFLENARGAAYEPNLAEHRVAAGRWLGRMHTTARGIDAAAYLPDRGPRHYLEHLQSARDAIERNLANPALSVDDVHVLLSILSLYVRLERNWQQLEDMCRMVPNTLVHGDFVEKNIRVQTGHQGINMLVFDWESAGWGIPVADLAQSPPTSRRFCAKPDILAYWMAVQGEWTSAGLDTFQRLAGVGTIFRLLAAINWVTQRLGADWVQRPTTYLANYESKLSSAVREVGWKA